MKSVSLPPVNVLLFGDYTDTWLGPIDNIYKEAATTPWLQTFLGDVTAVVRNESRDMDPDLAKTIGGPNIASLQETAEMYRDVPEEYGLAQCIMGFIMRAVPLLRWLKQNPDGLNLKNNRSPEVLGLSGGAINAAVLAISNDFASVCDASLEGIRVVCRLCRFAWIRSRAIEEVGGVWGRLVTGMMPDELDRVLNHFQNSMGIPNCNRVKVGVRGDKWSTLIGPPSVLKLCIDKCPTLRSLRTKELPIRSLQHNCPTTYEDLDYIAGNSELHERPVRPDFRLWGLKEPCAVYDNWGHLLRAVVDQTFSSPLDLVKVAAALSAGLGSEEDIQLHLMGPSCHAAYFAGVIEPGRHVSVVKSHESKEHLADISDRIAIVGMGGRGPGSTGASASDDLDHYWNVIMTGQDLVSQIPTGRFDAPHLFEAQERSHHAETSQNCVSTTDLGCFLANPGHFDSSFFSISPREAFMMNPGSRLFQMAAVEALQMAGYSSSQTRTTDPSRIAVFYGQADDDGYVTAHHEKGCDAYTLQAAQRAFVPGRVAFHHGWEGPTWAIDCACSTSSSLIHAACKSLLTRDIDMAVAGAANVMAFPHGFCGMSKSGCLSATGNCKTFRDDADGYCRGEFVGAVVLKRLEDAVAHNDNVLAIVAGSARNHSGNAAFITTSDARTQERLFRKALRDTRLVPSDISYVEMHGTGTPVGDPSEMTAVANVFGRRGVDQEHLVVGSVKANVGHSEGASGMSSLFKCILMYRDHVIPPQAGMPHPLNPNFPPLDKLKIDILSEKMEFKSAPGKPRRILLNNFDAAGGNACLLLEDPAETVQQNSTKNMFVDPRNVGVVVTSARSHNSHTANKRRLVKWLLANPGARLQDIAYSTTARNVHYPIRFACAVSSVQQLITELQSDTDSSRLDTTAQSTSSPNPPVVFIFSGQGSHYAGMGRELYHTSPVVRETVDMCARIGAEHGFPVFVDIITDDAGLDASQKGAVQFQLAIVTLEIALATFWRRAGVEPSLVIGHSLGEYAALYAAGVLSIADALYLVGQRSRLILQMCEPDTCGMLAILTSEATVKKQIETLALGTWSSLSVACINSPNDTVVSGSRDDLEQLKAAMTAKGIRSRTLAVPYGYHSIQVEPMLKDFNVLAAGVTFLRPKIAVASTLLSSIVDSLGVFGPDYLTRQTRRPVDFVGALQAAENRLRSPVWLEIGPTQVCGPFVRAILSAQSSPASRILSTLEARTGAWASVARCFASLYQNGIDLDWLGIHRPYEKGLQLLTLPSYAWDLKDYWIVYSEKRKEVAPENGEPRETEILYTCAQSLSSKSVDSVTFSASVAELAFKALMDGHQMRGSAICPGSAFSEAALVAAKYAFEEKGVYSNLDSTSLALHAMFLRRPLTMTLVGPRGTLLTKAVVEPDGTVSVTFRASSPGHENSFDLGSCVVMAQNPISLQARWVQTSYYIKKRMDEVIARAKDGNGHRMQSSLFYQLFSRTVSYHAEFYKCIKEAFISQDFEEAAAHVVLDEHPKGARFVASPYWGEGLVHLVGFLVNHHPARPSMGSTTMMMDSFESSEQTTNFEAGKSYVTYARICKKEENTIVCEVIIFDDGDRIVMQCVGLRFFQVNNSFLDTLRPVEKSKATATVPTPPNNAFGYGFTGKHGAASADHDAPRTVGNKSQKAWGLVERQESRHQKMETGTVKDSVDQHRAKEEDDQKQSSRAKVLGTILEHLAKETGFEISEFTDDRALTELGVDSIMAIEITAGVKEASGFDLLPTFMMDYPTIGDLRRAFNPLVMPPKLNELTMDIQDVDTGSGTSVSSCPQSPSEPAAVSTPPSLPQTLSDQINTSPCKDSLEDSSPLPKTRIVLLHGRRPKPDQMRLYLVADGCGTVSNYLPLFAHKYSMPIYGMDSPFFHCPSRLTSKIGIPGIAKLMVQALVESQPDGPLILGGYSGGATIAYEMCRQMITDGQNVNGLLLIDMRCPLAQITETREQPLHARELVWLLTQHAFTLDSSGVFNPNANSSLHLEALFACVGEYHPPPLPIGKGCPTAIIWCEKGMIGRLEKHPDLLQKVIDHGLQTRAYPGFMEDPKLGHVMWGLVHKTKADLGPNGWDKFVGGGQENDKENLLCLSVNADHSEIMSSTHARWTFEAIEKALQFFVERRES